MDIYVVTTPEYDVAFGDQVFDPQRLLFMTDDKATLMRNLDHLGCDVSVFKLQGHQVDLSDLSS